MEYIFRNIPYHHEDMFLALEQGITSFIIEHAYHNEASHIGNINLYHNKDIHYINVFSKEDEQHAVDLLMKNHHVLIQHGCDIIPLENIIAQTPALWLEIYSYEEYEVASQILEHGVGGVVFGKEMLQHIQQFYKKEEKYTLQTATITAIDHILLGDRACIDTLTWCQQGQGMLIGNSAGFLFLVHAETEYNKYVASRPFRINAGSIHNYVMLPEDRTCYLSELHPASSILLCDAKGNCSQSIVGRVKIEKRPMLMITAESDGRQGIIFLQNAETIALVNEHGEACSVALLAIGDTILVHLDTAGRHFGMRIEESILE